MRTRRFSVAFLWPWLDALWQPSTSLFNDRVVECEIRDLLCYNGENWPVGVIYAVIIDCDGKMLEAYSRQYHEDYLAGARNTTIKTARAVTGLHLRPDIRFEAFFRDEIEQWQEFVRENRGNTQERTDDYMGHADGSLSQSERRDLGAKPDHLEIHAGQRPHDQWPGPGVLLLGGTDPNSVEHNPDGSPEEDAV